MIGLVADRLALPPTVKVHDVFHVSFFKRYVKDVDHLLVCIAGGTRRRIPTKTSVHIVAETTHDSKLSN